MKILFAINSLILAGAEALTKDLALEFSRRGHTVEVAVLKRLHSAFEQQLESSGIRIFVPGLGGIYSPLHILPLRSVLRDYDAAIAMLFPATLWIALADGDTPLITSEQNTYNRRRASRLFRPLDSYMYSAYGAIICASSAIQESLMHWIPQTSARSSVVPNAIDVERFASARPLNRSALKIEADAPLLMFTSRFEAQKDHATLLRALAEVPKAHLFLAGDGPLRPQVEQLAQSLGIATRVHFLGRRADVPELLKSVDVYVHSSHYEGFGIAAIEAMAAGLPVIASDVPGLDEVVRGTGVLVPAGNSRALAEQIRLVLASSELRKEMTEKSLRRSRDFSIQKCADSYLAAVDAVIRKR